MALIGRTNEYLYKSELSLDGFYLFCHFGDEDIQLFRTLKETMLVNWKNKTIIENGDKKLILMKTTDILEFKQFIRATRPDLKRRTISFAPFNERASIKYLKDNRPISGFLDPCKVIHLSIPDIDEPAAVGDMNRISY